MPMAFVSGLYFLAWFGFLFLEVYMTFPKTEFLGRPHGAAVKGRAWEARSDRAASCSLKAA